MEAGGGASSLSRSFWVVSRAVGCRCGGVEWGEMSGGGRGGAGIG